MTQTLTRSTSPSRATKSKHRVLLVITVSTLPITYVPMELDHAGTSFAPVSVLLVLLCAIRYGAFRARMTAIEWAGIAMAIWIFTRITLFSAMEGNGARFDLVLQEVLPLLAGLLLFRIARQQVLRRPIILGLCIAIVIMIGFEAYQIAAGVGRLQALGYKTPRFNYYTESGAMRPFSTFLSPTVFAGYLAMVAAAVVFASRGRWPVVWLIATAGALALTYTRASWIAFAVALLATVMFSSPRVRSKLAIWIFPGLWVLLMSILLAGGFWQSLIARFDTLGESGYESNSVRLELWNAVVQAVANNPLLGFGGIPFADSLPPSLAVFTHAHSNYMQILYLYGGVGLGLFVILLVTMFAGLVRSTDRRQRLVGIAALVAFAVDSSFEGTWGSFAVASTLFLLIGLGMDPLPRAALSIDADAT